MRIGEKVRALRRSRRWSQAELAERLGLSQSRLSQIERGTSSLTAEQFLLLLKIFNVPVSQFAGQQGEALLQVQNVLARLGALHLHESAEVLPSEQLESVHAAVKEALVEASPRILTALAPVLVRHADRLNAARLLAELLPLGLGRRLGWVVENTLAALSRLPRGAASQRTRNERRAEVVLRALLERVSDLERPRRGETPVEEGRSLDWIEGGIRSNPTLDLYWAAASDISRRWGVVTRLKVDDFLHALEAARAGD